jgi:hypothetical protein
MVNTKIVVWLAVVSVLVAAIAGIALVQLANAQANVTRGVAGQVTQGSYGYGYSSSGGCQHGGSYGYGNGMGMSMCGRFW